MNKRGNVFAILLFIFLIIIFLFVMLGLAIGGSIVSGGISDLTSSLNNIGSVNSNINVSNYSQMSTPVLTDTVSQWPTLISIFYIIGVVSVLGLAFAFRESMSVTGISLFLISSLLVILSVIFISNSYESFYTQNDMIGNYLQSNQLMSFFILYSPAIISVVIFIAGIILFSGGGRNAEGY